MADEHILIIEDDEDIQQLVSYNLLKAGFQVKCAASAEEGLEMLQSKIPDLIVLDIMLPGIDGQKLCRVIRGEPKFDNIAILMLTAKSEEADMLASLNLGADDYITKPFSPKILIARIRAILRRSKHQEEQDQSEKIITIHNLTLDTLRYEVLVDGKPIPQLTGTELAILETLVRRPGWVFTRQQLINNIHSHAYQVTERLVDVQVFGLRKKLGTAGKLIETVRGVGYRCKEAAKSRT